MDAAGAGADTAAAAGAAAASGSDAIGICGSALSDDARPSVARLFGGDGGAAGALAGLPALQPIATPSPAPRCLLCKLGVQDESLWHTANFFVLGRWGPAIGPAVNKQM